MPTPFWTSQPSVLLKREYVGEVWPTEGMTSDEKLNAITRLVVLLTIVGFAVSRNFHILITAAITVGVIVLLHRTRSGSKTVTAKEAVKEAFTNPVAYAAASSLFQEPTLKNPVMNVLPTQIMENPNRRPAAPSFNPDVEKNMNRLTQDATVARLSDGVPEIAEAIDERLFRDLGDQFQFDQSMRQFYATANTQIPNDQGAFADFCYGDMISCEEGNPIACIKNNPRYTEGN